MSQMDKLFLFTCLVLLIYFLIHLVRQTSDRRENHFVQTIEIAGALASRLRELEIAEEERKIQKRARLMAKKMRYDSMIRKAQKTARQIKNEVGTA